ncbi:MAG: hypothetical protein IPL61_08655 [Myxococcales bacterium]|nr:hypothetical protein [Myxococcales bacterium]
MTGRVVIAALGLALARAAAAAPPADPDLAAETRSGFWDEATAPGTHARATRIADAVRALRLTSADLAAVERDLELLAAAAPDVADAWGYLAITAERRRHWATCARAYQRAYALAPAWRPEALIDLRTSSKNPLVRAPALSLALCQSRSDDLVGARATVDAAIARGEVGSELYLRAGEVALAQGRLTDAIDALGRSREQGAAWLQVMALDRARRDAEAQTAAERAAKDDPLAARAASGTIPLTPASDADYLLGIAARYRDQPDYAIVYLRRYLGAAPAASPWRARAEDHIAIATADSARAQAAVQASSGDGPAQDPLRAAVDLRAADLAACMRAVPTGLAEVRITVATPAQLKPSPFMRGGATPPRSPPRPVRGHLRPRPPPTPTTITPGVSAYYVLAPLPGDAPDARDEALRCLERVGASLRLPAPNAGAWATIRVPVRAR